MNSTINSTLFNTTTILTTQLQGYLENPLFLPFVFVFWSFMMTNHKYRQTLNTLESFKNQSADEIFSLQELLACESDFDTLCPCCANAAVTTLPTPHPWDAPHSRNLSDQSSPRRSVTGDELKSCDIPLYIRPTKNRATSTKKVKKLTTHTLSEYNLFLEKSIPDIKRDNPGIPDKLALIQATKMWQSKKS